MRGLRPMRFGNLGKRGDKVRDGALVAPVDRHRLDQLSGTDLAQATTRFAVNVPGGEHILFSIVEKPNGELILPIVSAERMGPNWDTGPRVLEHRYSIHTSPQSQDFTTIKQTINLATGPSVTTVALTDAVKKRTGFSLILVRRCQNLVDAPHVAFRHKHRDKLFVLPEFDPIKFTLFVGMFVGHPDELFGSTDDEIIISPFHFRTFQIVIMASLIAMPSHHTTQFVHALTTPPDLAKHEQQRELLHYLMMGKPASICIRQYRTSVKWLTKQYLEKMLPQITHQDVLDEVQKRISAIGDVTLTPQTLGIVGRSIHMLTDGKLPNPR